MSACQFSLLTCCFWPPPSPSLRTPHSCCHQSPIPYSSFLSPQSVFRIIIKFYFRHSIWEMSSVPDGFLTSPVIEYVRLFPTSFLVSTFFFFLLFGCLAADNFDVFSILRFFFCFSFLLFVRLLLKVWRGDFCAGVAAKLPKSCSALAPVEVFLRFHSHILFSLFFLSLLTSPSHLYWFGFCAFACALCRKQAEMLAVFRLALTWPWKPNYICGLFRIC